MKKLIRIMLVSLIVTSWTISLKAEKCFDGTKIHSLSEFKKNCDKCSLDLESTKTALTSCSENLGDSNAIVHVAGGLIGGTVLSFVVCSLTHWCN